MDYAQVSTGTWAGGAIQGHVLGCAIDLNKGLWWIKDITAAGNWNANAASDPVAGIYGYGIPVDEIYVMWGCYEKVNDNGSQTTTNFGATAFTGTMPSGYAPWDATGADPWLDDVKTHGLVLPPPRRNQPFDYGALSASFQPPVPIAPDLVLADGTSLPDDSDPDLAALRPLIEDDLFHDEPKDLLALDHARRIPQFGKILTQRDNLSAVRRGKRYRLLAAPAWTTN